MEESVNSLPGLAVRAGGARAGQAGGASMTMQGALSLAMAGLYVLPCAPTKRPLTGHGVHDATRDPAIITRWWQDHPHALVGVACGHSGLLCLDFDNEEVYKKWGQDYPDLPPTWLDKTPRGYHIWYKVPGGVKIKSVASPFPAYQGVDIRAYGGYAIVYNPEGYTTPAVLPPRLLVLFNQNGVVKEDQPPREPAPASATPKKQCGEGILGGDYWLKQALDRAFVGNRNETGFWLACQLRDAGLSEAEAAHYMREFQRSVSTTKEPYTEAEAMASLRSAYNGAPREPVVLQKQKTDEEKPEEPEAPLEEVLSGEEAVRSKAMEILRMGRPVEYIMEAYHRMHVGDDNHGRLLLVSIGCQLAGNTRGIHPAMTGESGDGKTDATQAMAHLLPREYLVMASITDKVLYYKPLKPGTVIFLDDIQNMSEGLQEIIKQTTSFYQEGYDHWTLDKNRRPLHTRIPPRCAWWITSVGNDFQDQLINRQMLLTVESGSEHKQQIMRHQLSLAKTGTSDRPEDETVWTCRAMIRILKEQPLRNVVIPYADRILWYNWENPRNLPMFLDTIRAYAMLHMFQRQVDENGNIVATLEDYEMARKLWGTISRSQVSKLTNREIACIQAIQQLGGEADINQIAEKMGRARNTVLEILNGVKGKGGLCGKIVLKRENITETKHGSSGSTSTRRIVYYLPKNVDILGNYTEIVSLAPATTTNTTSTTGSQDGPSQDVPLCMAQDVYMKTTTNTTSTTGSQDGPSQDVPLCMAQDVYMKRLYDIINDLTRESVRKGGPRGATEKGIVDYMMTFGMRPEDTRRLLEKLLARGVLTRLPNAPYYYQVVTT